MVGLEDVFRPTAFDKPLEDCTLKKEGFAIFDAQIPKMQKMNDRWKPIFNSSVRDMKKLDKVRDLVWLTS